MRVCQSLFILFSLYSVLLCPAFAQHTQQLFEEDTSIELSKSLYYLHETDLPLTIGDVSNRRSDFRMHPHDNPNFGFRSQGMWLLTSFANITNEEDWVLTINFSQLDKVDFYLVQDGKVLSQSHQGKSQQEQRFRVPTFRVHLPNPERVDVYIRIESQFVIFFNCI